jgi:hypothetical protein
MNRRPWFAIRDIGDGYGLNVIHWKGVAALLAAFAVSVAGLLGGALLFAEPGLALGLGGAVMVVALAVLYVVIMRRIVDERP